MASLEQVSGTENTLDREIVELVDIGVFPEFTFDTQLLNNWQTELTDVASDPQLLANITRHEIVIHFPQGPVYFDESNMRELLKCLERLSLLDFDVYADFQLVIHEVIFCATTSLYTGKIQLHRNAILDILITDFARYAYSLKSGVSDLQGQLCSAKIRLLSSFLALGCEPKQFKQILLPLFAKTAQISFETKKAFLNLLFAFLEKCPSKYLALLFNKFSTRPVTIPINQDSNVLKCFTVSTWFKLNKLASSEPKNDDYLPLTLILLANSADRESLVFQIQLWNNKFIVNIVNSSNRSKRQFSFNHELKENPSLNQGFTHFVLTYDSYQNLNLYIDGEYSESIPCSTISKGDIRWNKLYIGDPLELEATQLANTNIFAKQELIVKDLAVMDLAIKFEWVSLFYLLGIGFDWSQKEFSDLNILGFLDSLSRKNYILMSYRAEEIAFSRTQKAVYRGDSRQNSSSSTKSAASPNHHFPTKAEIVNLLAKTKIRNSNFLFDINDSQFVEFIDQSKSQEIMYHRFNSFCNSLYCWGGSGLLLLMIEAVMKDDYDDELQRNALFFETLRLLLLCLEGDWRISKEFENIDGYWAFGLLVDHFRVNYNAELVFKEWGEYQNTEKLADEDQNLVSFEGSFLEMLIRFSSTSQNSGPFISNTLAFKVVVLNFDLFSDTKSFFSLQAHIIDLLASEKHKNHNFKELSKMRVLKKLLQHIKVCLIEGANARKIEALTRLLTTCIHFEISVESIKHVSNFIIFALYYESANEDSQQAGLQALLALTNKLCGSSSSIKLLKKFSRSISIHWILLLLDFESENKHMAAKVVCCAIGLLSKFLRVLGLHVIKRFFQANKGLNVLSYFLQNWWNNDNVISILFINSFGVDSDIYGSSVPLLPELVKDKRITHASGTVPIPDFINLLNKLALSGVTQLGQKQGRVLSTPSSPIRSILTRTSVNDQIAELSFDIMHLLNQMSDMIEFGFSESAALQSIFETTEWLEGAFEIIAHLKILRETSIPTSQVRANFETCVAKYVSVLSAIFVSMLLDVRKMFTIMNALNDITKKLMIETVFPKIFEHINGFLCNSNFIFKELEFVRGTTEILIIYHSEFVLQNYYVSPEDLETYTTSLVGIIETSDPKSNIIDRLGPILGHTLIMQLSNISNIISDVVDFEEDLENDFARDLDEKVKFCLYKQALLLQPMVLSDTMLRLTIELVMGNFLKLSPHKQLQISDHVLNFLRSAIVMRQEDFGKIMVQLTQLSDYQNSIEILSGFFSFLTTHNDEETVKYIQKFPTTKHIFNKNFHFRLSKLKDIGQINVLDMVQVVINNGGSLGSMNNSQLQSFEKDCQTLKSVTITGELVKFNRELQDAQENTNISSSSYSTLKLEIHRLLQESPIEKSDFMLDYIEGANRMRMLTVGEDQLPESEKLSYNVKVPVKKLDTEEIHKAANLSLDSVFSAFGIQDLLYLENSSQDLDLNEYEEIDENGESTNSSKSVNEDRNRKVIRSLYLGDQIQTLFNVSKVNGLDAVESLMILGYSHIYFIENFFHCDDGNIVDIDEVAQELRDPYLQFIKPQSADINGVKSYRIKAWSLENFACVCKRKFLLRDIALELFFDDGASLLITCLSKKQRDFVYSKLSPYSSGTSLDKDFQVTLEVSTSMLQLAQTSLSSGFHFKSRLVSALSAGFTNSPSFSEITKKWKMGKMSNFYYLLSINTMAGRTFNDLTQYPIFPWVIADYESDVLDLNDPETFRDFSKPMGAQTPKRAREYQDRYEALASMQDASAPPFHYGTHYSSAMIVTSYLIRLKPYVQSYLLLQGGKFDHADRLFNSIGKAWSSASKENTTDVRELTPEFFYLPEFLENRNDFEFGKLQSGESSNDVELPNWAKGDPKIFIAKNREALESPYVSAHLHQWIDLVFGFKQSGEEAVNALNVFHHLSYDGAINLDNIKDEMEKRALIGMINNFGQTPVKLFSKPHPPREILNLPYLQLSLSEKSRRPPVFTFESKLHLPIEKLEISTKSRKWIGRPLCTSSEDQILIRKPSPGQLNFGNGSLIINTTLFMNLHLSNITSLIQIGNKFFMTGSDDGIIHVWKCSVQPNLSVSYHSVLRGHLSAIKSLCYSKTFKVCLSVDVDGGIIQWDLTRFKYVRRITNALSQENLIMLVAISNDTGNFCTVQSTKYKNVLTMYTLNGEQIKTITLKPGRITAVSIAQVNDSLVELIKTEYRHSYWNDEFIVLSYSSPQLNLQIYKLHVDNLGWAISLVQEADLKNYISGHVSSMQVYKKTEICEEDRLSRGRLLFILGDSKGRVYVW